MLVRFRAKKTLINIKFLNIKTSKTSNFKHQRLQHYVCEIEEVSGRLAKINYLRKSSEKSIFPEWPDFSETDFNDIIMKLPTPFAARGTGRSGSQRPCIWVVTCLAMP